ncbi:BMP family protein [Chloroflexota bacterium]
MRIKKAGFIVIAIMVFALSWVGCAQTTPSPTPSPAPAPSTPTEEAIKMAILTFGERTDGSWAQGHYDAYLYLKDKYPEVDLTFRDAFPFGDFPAIVELYGEEGMDLVVLDSGSAWGEALRSVAPRYPDTWFIVVATPPESLFTMPDNVVAYNRQEWEGCFLAGVAAGMRTETNKVGFVGGMPYAAVIELAAALELGAKWINPQVEYHAIYTGDWVDVEAGYESARALIDSGVDVILQHADNAGLGVIQACQEAGVWVIGETRDQSDLAPDNIITSHLTSFGLCAESALFNYKAGLIRHGVNIVAIQQGWDPLHPLTNVPAGTAEMVEKVREAMEVGTIVIPGILDAEALGTLSPSDYGIPSRAELGY